MGRIAAEVPAGSYDLRPVAVERRATCREAGTFAAEVLFTTRTPATYRPRRYVGGSADKR